MEESPVTVYLGGLSRSSRRVARGALDTVARIVDPSADAFSLPWHQLRRQHTEAIRAALLSATSGKTGRPLSASTINHLLSALRRVLYHAWKLGWMSDEDYQSAVDVKNVRGAPPSAPRSLTPDEIAAVLAACTSKPGPAGARDAAIFRLLYSCGLRRAEVVALNREDYDENTGRLLVRGKGREERIVWAVNGTAAALADWLVVRGDDSGPLFCPIRKGGHVVAGCRLGGQAVYDMLRRRAVQAGVGVFTLRDLRSVAGRPGCS